MQYNICNVPKQDKHSIEYENVRRLEFNYLFFCKISQIHKLQNVLNIFGESHNPSPEWQSILK